MRRRKVKLQPLRRPPRTVFDDGPNSPDAVLHQPVALELDEELKKHPTGRSAFFLLRVLRSVAKRIMPPDRCMPPRRLRDRSRVP